MTKSIITNGDKPKKLATLYAIIGTISNRVTVLILIILLSAFSVDKCNAAPIQISPKGKLVAANNFRNWSLPKGSPIPDKLITIPITQEIINGFLIIGKINWRKVTFCPAVKQSTEVTFDRGTKVANIKAAIPKPSTPNKSATIAKPK